MANPKTTRIISFKTLCVGLVGCVLISASSLYVALRMGALPWTLFLAAMASFVLLRKPVEHRMARVNFSHTMMTAGSMLAGALAFVLPAASLLGIESHFTSLAVIVFLGILLGLFSCWYLRDFFLQRLKLPYPIGQSVYSVIGSYGSRAGNRSGLLSISIAASSLFAFLRDGLARLPQTIFSGRMLFSLMPIGLGYLMRSGGLYWGVSGLFTHIVISPLMANILEDSEIALSSDEIWKSLSLGMLISCGLTMVIKGLYRQRMVLFSTLKVFFLRGMRSRQSLNFLTIFSLAILVLTFFTPLTWLQALLLIPLILLTNIISMLLCGQTGINPLETFGILIFLILSLFIKILPIQAVLMMLCAAIASGLCGDLMNDFKVGQLSQTSPKPMFIAEIIGAGVGVTVTFFLFFIIKDTMGPFGTPTLPVPQATAIATIIKGSVHQGIFSIGLVVGILAGLARHGLFIIMGIYLPVAISTSVGLGGLLFVCTKRRAHLSDSGESIATGLLIGESLMGTLLAIKLLP